MERHTGQRCLYPTPLRAGTDLFLEFVTIFMVGNNDLNGTNLGKRWHFLVHGTELYSGQGCSWLQVQLDPGANLQMLSLPPVTFFSALSTPLSYCRSTSHDSCKKQLLDSHPMAFPPKKDCPLLLFPTQKISGKDPVLSQTCSQGWTGLGRAHWKLMGREGTLFSEKGGTGDRPKMSSRERGCRPSKRRHFHVGHGETQDTGMVASGPG